MACKLALRELKSVDKVRPKLLYLMWVRPWPNVRQEWRIPGPGCSKLTTSLVNVLLKFQMLISEICQYFLLKKCEKLLQCKSFSHFSTKNISVFVLKL